MFPEVFWKCWYGVVKQLHENHLTMKPSLPGTMHVFFMTTVNMMESITSFMTRSDRVQQEAFPGRLVQGPSTKPEANQHRSHQLAGGWNAPWPRALDVWSDTHIA